MELLDIRFGIYTSSTNCEMGMKCVRIQSCPSLGNQLPRCSKQADVGGWLTSFMAHFPHWDTSILQFMMQDVMNSAVILTPLQRHCQYINLACFPTVQG